MIAPLPSAWIQVAGFLECVAREKREAELGHVLEPLLAAGRRLRVTASIARSIDKRRDGATRRSATRACTTVPRQN